MSRSRDTCVFFNENQSCSPFNSVQDTLSIKLWGPLFDGFVDISIFMIWGSLGVVWLDVPDPTSVLGGSVPSGGYFLSENPVLEMRNTGFPVVSWKQKSIFDNCCGFGPLCRIRPLCYLAAYPPGVIFCQNVRSENEK